MARTAVIVIIALLSLADALWFSSSGGDDDDGNDNNYHYEISTQAGLRQLYNTHVVRAERWQRPLADSAPSWVKEKLGLMHSGVVVHLANGQKFLVHKGDEYGRQHQTVVTSAANMGWRWTRTNTKTIYRSTVSDYVEAGGRSYSLLFDNCHDASRRMLALN